jgi:transposase
MCGLKPVVVELSENERGMLGRWVRWGKTAQALVQRFRIILACAGGGSNTEIAAELGIARDTVAKWRGRFVTHRLEGLADEPRPGAPRKITDEQVESVIVKTLEESPANGDTHWSTRSMAKATGMSQSAISRMWRAFRLKPHSVQTWKLGGFNRSWRHNAL